MAKKEKKTLLKIGRYLSVVSNVLTELNAWVL